MNFDPLKTTLDRLSHVDRYNKIIYESIKPYLGNVILEIGAGIGNISKLLKSSNNQLLIITDFDDEFIKILEDEYNSDEKIKIHKLDISIDAKLDNYKNIDTIVCINVLEHIKDDVKALSNCYELLSRGGNLILFVPAIPKLYGSLDKSLGHYRRYSLREIENKLNSVGFRVIFSKYFNIVGIIGWFISSKIFKRELIPSYHLKVFNLITPLLKLEKRIRIPIGLSLIAVGKKG